MLVVLDVIYLCKVCVRKDLKLKIKGFKMSIFNCIRYPLYNNLYKGYSCIRDGSYDEDPNEAATYDLFMEKNLLQ